jgi:hypothetical protein
MIRRLSLSLALLALASYVPAQAPPAVPGAPQGLGRGGQTPVVTGPSAPVPPEVAIPRPTPEEVARVNDEMTKWIASNTSSAGDFQGVL